MRVLCQALMSNSVIEPADVWLCTSSIDSIKSRSTGGSQKHRRILALSPSLISVILIVKLELSPMVHSVPGQPLGAAWALLVANLLH